MQNCHLLFEIQGGTIDSPSSRLLSWQPGQVTQDKRKQRRALLSSDLYVCHKEGIDDLLE